MSRQRKILGNNGEELAAKYLIQEQYTILARNYRTKIGEIDIIAQKGDDIIIVEVKTKTDFTQGEAIELIDPKKIRKLKLLAKQLWQNYPDKNLHCDAIAIDMTKSHPELKHIENIITDF
jgi:putative endonuclease